MVFIDCVKVPAQEKLIFRKKWDYFGISGYKCVKSEIKSSISLNTMFDSLFVKNFEIFTRKHRLWSLFQIKLQALRDATFLKSDSNTGVLRNF